MREKIKLTSLLLALSITLVACDSSNDDNNSNDNEDKTTEESNNSKSTDASKSKENNSDKDSDDSASKNIDEINLNDFNKSLKDAIEEAKSRFDGELNEIGIEEKSNQWVYDIELESDSEKYEIAMNVDTLEVIKEEQEVKDDQNKNEYFKYEDLVNVEDAVKTAKEQLDGKVTEIGTDWDDQKLYYEITILKDDGDDVDVMIDAHSGDFVEFDD